MATFSNPRRSIRHIVHLRHLLRRWRLRSSTPFDVPSGHVAVSVGSNSRRFVVKTSHLNHPAFQKLLTEAEEEYGFDRPGPLAIPCDEDLFVEILHRLRSDGRDLTGCRGRVGNEAVPYLRENFC